MPQLQDHLLEQMLERHDVQGLGLPEQFTDKERVGLQFYNNKIYFHQVMRVNYTTYDMRREQDTINECLYACLHKAISG